MRPGARIVVTGFAATYPFGGVFWDYMQYLLGLHRLGHDVLYIEDTARWCYDPVAQTFGEGGGNNAAFLSQQLGRLDPELADRWFFRDASGATFGKPWPKVVEFCRSADLFLNISASCWMRDEYFAASRTAFIDSDPMYTQASVPGYVEGNIVDEDRARVDMLLAHDVFFTFAENIGSPDCLVPRELFDWMPTRQPVVLDCFASAQRPVAERRKVFTTVASWEPSLDAGPVINGVAYTGKSTEFLRFIDLPRRSAVPLEIALSGGAPRERLAAHGWGIVDAASISADPWIYRRYLADSLGEWSVAKNAYARSRSGWFSCRTACYLALGVPAVVQDTGFSVAIPCGDGLFAFDSEDSAAAAIDAIVTSPARHSAAALEMAKRYFDSETVLTDLLTRAFAGSAARVPAS